MENKEILVLKAAKEVFLKYGYVKVTMNDIAKQAGMSRPALYLIYPGKEHIYNAVILYLAGELSERIKRESAELSDPMDKLKKVFEVWTVEMHEILNRSEEAKELYQSTFPFAKESIKKTVLMFEKDIAAALEQFPEERLNRNITRGELAHVFANGMSGFKQNAENSEDLKYKIDLLIKMSMNNKDE